MTVPQGTFDLRRVPAGTTTSLRAWDAADELVLAHLGELSGVAEGPVVVVNDAFGALTTALASDGPVISISDSYVGQERARENVVRNGLDPDSIEFRSPLDPLDGGLRAVVVKVPKSLALLEHELAQVRSAMTPETVIVGAGMARHIHTSTLELWERLIGPTTTSLATKKARLIHSTLAQERPAGPATVGASFKHDGLTVTTLPGVFSYGRLDIGTRLLLDHLPTVDGTVVDVGCGAGVIGALIARENPEAEVAMIDESHLAVASARKTVADADLGDNTTVLVGDGLAEIANDSVDLVVSNPPFHDDHAVGDAFSWNLFNEARRVLRPGGEIRIVGNQHLGYHVKLGRIFGNYETVASNPKFVVLSATV